MLEQTRHEEGNLPPVSPSFSPLPATPPPAGLFPELPPSNLICITGARPARRRPLSENPPR